MKILYDHQMFLTQKYGGITKYFCELMKNLPAEHQFRLSVLISENQHLKDEHSFFKKIHVPIPKNDFKGRGFLRRNLYNINRLYSRYVISLNDYDLLHPTYFDPYFLKGLKKPYIVTVHDLIEFKFKELYRKNSRMSQMKEIINNADRIISISENTKKDLIEILNIRAEKIDVIYHGFNKPSSKIESNPHGRYILFVGRRESYKNFTAFAKAVGSLMVKDNDLKMICVGEPFNKVELENLKNLKILKKTTAIGVDENKLNSLYSNALVFVYPSLYEGFGMPILEAFANNCPVCLSNTSSFPEVAGDAGVYFNPNDQDSISNAIERVIYDSGFTKKIIAAGDNLLNNFSWKKCTEQTLNSYKRVLE
ncbi:MAG TPA: glycosyltransferase family 1 protein [Hanamia sp.]